MKRINILHLLIFLLLPASLYARPVEIADAEKASRKWIAMENVKKTWGGGTSGLTYEAIEPWVYGGQKIGYVVSLAPDGFMLIPAATELAPIKFMAFNGRHQQVRHIPFLAIMEGRLADTLAHLGYSPGRLAALPLEPTDTRQLSRNEAAWQMLLTESGLQSSLESSQVEPLLTSKWNQWDPYSLFVPEPSAPNPVLPTGCSATAMAQIMYYWKHPASGQGTHSYYWQYGSKYLNADFNHAYDWSNMLDTYTGGESTTQRQAVAQLMSDVGLALSMQYAPLPEGSAAYPYANDALVAFFKYSPGVNQVRRSDYSSSSEWFELFKGQLDNQMPVLLTVHGIAAGYIVANHAVVIDGYRSDGLVNYIHANLGWGGQADGYYAMDNVYGESDPQSDYALVNIYKPGFVPNTSVSGFVTGYDGLPIEHVEVQIWKETAPAVFQKVSAAQTDANGFYALVVTPGRYKIYFYSEIANFYLWEVSSTRRFNSEWYDNQGSLNWDMMIDYVETITISSGEKTVLDPVLDRSCSVGTMGNPAWFVAIPYGNGDYSLQWGIDSYGERYRLQRASQADYSDVVPCYLGLPAPYPFEHRLSPGTHYYRVRKENVCGASLWTTLTLEVPFWNQNGTIYLPLILNGSSGQ